MATLVPDLSLPRLSTHVEGPRTRTTYARFSPAFPTGPG
jgi:hypothetical protein